MRPRNISLLFLIATTLALAAGPAPAELLPEWTTRLPVGTSLSAGLAGSHIGDDGTTYLAATSGSGTQTDILVAAIADDGVVLWSNTWDGPQAGGDQARDVALAADGTLYVTGNTPAASGHANVALLSYDSSSGQFLDSVVYSSGPFLSEAGHYVVPGATGEVYVVGSTVGDGGDVLVIKFSATGQPVWTRTWDGPASAPFSNDTPRAVRLDANGDLVVGIHGVMSSLHPDYVVIKYAQADGATVWETNWGVSGGDYLSEIEIDANGDVFATGIGIDLIDKISTLRLRGTDGGLLWQRYDAEGFDHTANGIELDGSGGVYITGTSDPDGDDSNFNEQYFTIKRDALSGDQLWTHHYGDSCVGCFDKPSDVVVDTSDRVFVTGVTSSPPYLNDTLLFVLDANSGLELDRGVTTGTGSEIPATGRLGFDAAFNLYDAGGVYNADTGAIDVSVVKWPTLDGGIPCADTSRFQARCDARPAGNLIRLRLLLTDRSHHGEQVSVDIDGEPFVLPIVGRRAVGFVRGAAPGGHTLTLTEPGGCFPPRIVVCPGS